MAHFKQPASVTDQLHHNALTHSVQICVLNKNACGPSLILEPE